MADLMTAQSAATALWFLPFAAPICVWAAASDVMRMKIPNKSVMALILVFAIIGLIALPLEDYLWRYAHLVVVMVLGFVMNMMRLLGAGDAKFAAAMALFIPLGDLNLFAMLFAVAVLVGFVLHRLARATAPLRAATPNWVSWSHKGYPMGLSLGGSLILYLAVVAFYAN